MKESATPPQKNYKVFWIGRCSWANRLLVKESVGQPQKIYKVFWQGQCSSRDVPLAKSPSTGTAQQRLFLVLKVVLHAVVGISEVLRFSTKNRCSRCCRAHLYAVGQIGY